MLAAALLVASLGAVAALVASPTGAPGDAGAFEVLVVGPSATWFDATVRTDEATALSLLLATGLAVEVDTYPGMGAFVSAIEGHRAQGGAGWIYEVDAGEGWVSGDRSPADRALHEGERLAWRWTGAKG